MTPLRLGLSTLSLCALALGCAAEAEDVDASVDASTDARTMNADSVGSVQDGGAADSSGTVFDARTDDALSDVAADSPEPRANLLFRSGFEAGTALGSAEDGYHRLTGTDAVSEYTWDESLGGLWGSSNNGIHVIHGGGISGGIENALQSVTGHDGVETRALYQTVAFSSGAPTAQTPYQINNIVDDPDEYYISYWIKLDDSSLGEPDQWRIVWQYKTDRFDYQHEEPGYRISVYIYTDDDGAYWHVKGDDQNPDYWAVSDRDAPVPRDEWFHVEIYSKVSADDDGRFWAKINGIEIASHDGPNLGSAEDTMAFMMLWQLYGSSYPAHQWIDDVEIWDGVPY